MQEFPVVPFSFSRRPSTEMLESGRFFLEQMRRRRSLRQFSAEPVPRELIELAIQIAGTAPSGANRQPWKFVAVSDPAIKRTVREAAEREEKKSYEERMPDEWLEALAPLGTDWHKPFLESAPWIVVVFAESFKLSDQGGKSKNYYVQESVGIACGFFICAVHLMGLVTLTHTPSPMGFLSAILGRPSNERPYLIFPVGFPAPDAVVPRLDKKSLADLAIWQEPT